MFIRLKGSETPANVNLESTGRTVLNQSSSPSNKRVAFLSRQTISAFPWLRFACLCMWEVFVTLVGILSVRLTVILWMLLGEDCHWRLPPSLFCPPPFHCTSFLWILILKIPNNMSLRLISSSLASLRFLPAVSDFLPPLLTVKLIILHQ